MCYHASYKAKASELMKAFNAKFPDEAQYQPFYHANGFAHPKLPALVKPDELRALQWGLIPSWKNKTLEQMMVHSRHTLNARDREIHTTPSYKNNIMKYRCILPLTGFFEPHTHEGVKYPFYITPKDGGFFLAAGLYSHWKNPATNEWLSTCSAITTDANRPLKKIHNAQDRMVVLMTPENAYTWLEPDLPQEAVNALMAPCEEHNIKAYSISRDLFLKVDSNRPDIFDQVWYEELSYDQELYNGFNMN